MKFTVIILFLLFSDLCSSQHLNSPEDSLKYFGDAMFSMKLPEHKQYSEQQFLRLCQQLIQTNQDSSLLNFHPSFVMCESADKKIKIISWQIDASFQDYHYCAYIFADSAKPVFLKSVVRNLSRINFEIFTNKNWYGAMYYHILPVKIKNYYTLFGYCFSNDGFKHRIIDVLKIENNNIQLGAPLFIRTDEKGVETAYFRHVMRYSPSANIALRYEEDSNMLFFDHIEQITDPKSGEILLVPDGTFEAYELKDDKWNFIPYQKGEILKTAPREKPVLGKDQKDLFGKNKKK